jgi:hypothetical protein
MELYCKFYLLLSGRGTLLCVVLGVAGLPHGQNPEASCHERQCMHCTLDMNCLSGANSNHHSSFDRAAVHFTQGSGSISLWSLRKDTTSVIRLSWIGCRNGTGFPCARQTAGAQEFALNLSRVLAHAASLLWSRLIMSVIGLLFSLRKNMTLRVRVIFWFISHTIQCQFEGLRLHIYNWPRQSTYTKMLV